MKFKDIVEDYLIEAQTIDDIKDKYVGDGKLISPKLFDEIINAANGKLAYIKWLVIRVNETIKTPAKDIIRPEDVYKFKDYFQIFDENKSKFEIKDINQYKTGDDVKKFISNVIAIREKNVSLGDINEKDKYVSKNEIEKLENFGIKYYGMVDGYQVFEVPSSLKGNNEAWKAYKNIFGRCKGRSEGATIDICTIAGFDHFNYYFEEYPDSSYFVIFNMDDPKSPYQFHYEDAQFHDKNNQSVF